MSREKRDTTDGPAPDINIIMLPDSDDKTVDPAAAIDEFQRNESRFRSMIRRIANSPMLTSQDLVQLLSIVISLLLMAYLGPLAGNQAALLQSLLRQIIPVALLSIVGYISTKANDGALNPEIADVPLAPVAPPSSFASSLI